MESGRWPLQRQCRRQARIETFLQSGYFYKRQFISIGSSRSDAEFVWAAADIQATATYRAFRQGSYFSLASGITFSPAL